MLFEVVLGATFGGIFSGVLSYYAGFHYGKKKAKRNILLPYTMQKNRKKCKHYNDSSKTTNTM